MPMMVQKQKPEACAQGMMINIIEKKTKSMHPNNNNQHC
jgi:hypothetical protein